MPTADIEIGQLYPATLLARIVTLEIEGEKASRDWPPVAIPRRVD
jgi:hypothetical protein